MTPAHKLAALLLPMISAASFATAEPAGLTIESMFMPHHAKETRAAIWYPSGGGGAVEPYADNPVFVGLEVAMGAEIAPGRHPLVLLSHGMGGTDRALAWLASDLAARGAIVAVVNHPGTTWGDHDMARGVRHWTRAEDMRAALDGLLEDPRYAPRIDRSRIMAAGFSYGGWTALSLGGLRGNHAGIVAACETHGAAMEACELLLSEEVRLQDQDPALWNASRRDARVTQVVAIDPGFVWGLEAGDVAGLEVPAVMVGLGGGEDRMLATDFDRSGLAALLPGVTVLRHDPANHFTMMPICKPEGAALLQAEDDDPVCTDPEGSERAALHAEIAGMIAGALGL
ncbi:alpha/beta hydrolase family protein [Vannielia litorea]|uniref:Predicted dienelactone hydrolase n=1 Tax=Vannielia litorea TaxID=1217970 RepID=A0A1N6H5M0_9RHOB|nr:prolyl oligopeptidase family serine peptidase [Vannielia litorea]SIO15043.1 Predicted dienelactone hydrolase [Vannielia litorea]